MILNKIALRPALLICLMILVAQHAGAVTIDGYDVRVVAGGGAGPDGSTALEAKLVVPFGAQLDRAGNLYIAEFNGGRIRKVDTKGVLTTIAGDGTKNYSGDGGPASKATFKGLHMHVVTPEGDVYVADTHNHCVRKIDHKTGNISTVAGTGKKGYSGDGGPATKAQFSGIYCNAINPAMDKIYVADLNNKRIRVIDLKTGIADTVAGSGKRGVPKDGAIAKNSPLVDPRAVAADRHGNVYVLERGGHALRVVTPDGKIRTLVGTGKKGAKNGPGRQASLNGPKHLCIDLDDNVIIADAENRLIRKYDVKTGQISTLLSASPGQKKGDKPIRLGRPHGVYVHTDDTLYIADSYNGRILAARKK
jgi:sugar lactone lactonase YvrE